MPDIWLAWLAILCGFSGLIWSADRFVDSSAAIAGNFGLSKLIIGLTIVSLGTSAPEIVVSISASLKDAGDMAIGNALGSNLANVGLVLAITALIAPMPIQRHLLTQEIPVLLLVTALAGVILWDTTVTLTEGIILLGSIGPLLYLMAKHKKEHPEENDDDDIPELSLGAASAWFVIGLGTLIASSEILVWGATLIATDFGVSPLIIGLTVVAVGTSLPELAASVMSGHASAVAALARFGSAAQGDPIYEAGVQLGRLLRTAFLADYFVKDAFRNELRRVLNRGEAVNALKRAIYTGRISPAQAKRVDEMQAVADALSLMANIVMAWNTSQMQAVLDRWSNRRQAIPPELIGKIAPPGWKASTCEACSAFLLTVMPTKSCPRGREHR